MDPFFLPKALGFCTDPPVERVQPAWWTPNNISEKSSNNFNTCWCNCKDSASSCWGNLVDRLLLACWEVQQPVEQPTFLHECAFPAFVAAASTSTPVCAVPPGKLPPSSPVSWRQRFWLLQQQHMLQLRQQENEMRKKQELQTSQLQQQLVLTTPATVRATNTETKCRATNAASGGIGRGVVAASCQQSKGGPNSNAYGAVRSATVAPKFGGRRDNCFHYTSQLAATASSAAHSVEHTAVGSRSVRRSPDQGPHVSRTRDMARFTTPVSLSGGKYGLCSGSTTRGCPGVVDHVVPLQTSSATAVISGAAHPANKIALLEASGKPVWGKLQEIPTPYIYLPCTSRCSDSSSPARANAMDLSGLSTTTTRVSSSEYTFPPSARFASLMFSDKHT